MPGIPRNLWVNLLFGCLSSAASSLTNGGFFSNYIVSIGLGDTAVGLIFSTAGLVMVALAVPLGILTDRLARQVLLRAGVAAGLASAVAQTLALQLRHVPLLYAAAGLSGMASAIVGPALAANFADSIQTGDRTLLYTWQYSGSIAAGALGPLAALPYLYYRGNAWEVGTLTVVMQAGNAIYMVAYLLLLLIRDDAVLGKESEGVLAKEAGSGSGSGSADAEAPLLERAADADAAPAASGGAPAASKQALGLGHQTLALGCCTLRVRHIPYLLFASDITIALGAGASIAFFPLYFTQGLQPGLTPMALSAVFAGLPLLIALAGFLLVPLSKRMGRAPAALAANLVGTAALFALVFIRTPWVAISTYLLRSSAMNASYAVQRGILMDVVSKENRGKWSSVENLTAATWTGSSLVGGFLVQRYSFQTVFFGTACLYCVGNVILALVTPLTWGEKVDAGKAAAGPEEGQAPLEGASVNASE